MGGHVWPAQHAFIEASTKKQKEGERKKYNGIVTYRLPFTDAKTKNPELIYVYFDIESAMKQQQTKEPEMHAHMHIPILVAFQFKYKINDQG